MVGCRRFRRLWQARWPGRSNRPWSLWRGRGLGRRLTGGWRGIGRWGRLEVDSLEFLGGLFLKWTVYSIAMERDGTTLACDGMWTGFWMECGCTVIWEDLRDGL